MRPVLFILFFCSSAMAADSTRTLKPDAASFEAMGRGLLWSVNYDRTLIDSMAVGLGFGTVGTKTATGGDGGTMAYLLPLYYNYYFMLTQGSIYATAGVDFVINSGSVKNLGAATGNVDFPSYPVMPVFGAGYENRSASGFMFRFALYGIWGDGLDPWGGFSFGYCF